MARRYGTNHSNRSYGKREAQLMWQDSPVDAYKVSFTYDKTVVDFLKVTIPSHDRAWEPDLKSWFVQPQYFPALKAYLEAVGYTVTTFTRDEAEKFKTEAYKRNAEQQAFGARRQVNLKDEWQKFLQLTRHFGDIDSLPFNDVKRIYRRAALELHPDRNNGDGSRMAELNRTWDRLKMYHFEKKEDEVTI